MTNSKTFDLNGYIIDVPPAGKFDAGAPSIGTSWPSHVGTQAASAWTVSPFPKSLYSTPAILMRGVWRIGGDFEDAPLLRPVKWSFSDFKDPTFFVLRTVTMHYVWKAIIVDLNTAGGYSQDQTFQTGVQTSTDVTTSFGAKLGVEVSGKVPLLGGIGVKLSAAYNMGETTKKSTVLTQSSSITQHIKADPNQTFIQWQLFTRHHIAPPSLATTGIEPTVAKAYFDVFNQSDYAKRNADIEIVEAPLLTGGQGVYSSTMYPA
jgi:hypothetical protein